MSDNETLMNDQINQINMYKYVVERLQKKNTDYIRIYYKKTKHFLTIAV